MEYKTISNKTEHMIIIEKSKFICNLTPVQSEEEAFEFISLIKKKYKDASHNVWGFQLKDGMTRRYNDDGEPSGTAGVPTLNVLIKAELTNVCAVVTRYFGGVKLGAGGLIRAYSASVSSAIEEDNIIKMETCQFVNIELSYQSHSLVNYYINEKKIKTIDTEFSDVVKITILLPIGQVDHVKTELVEKTGGNVIISCGEKIFSHI